MKYLKPIDLYRNFLQSNNGGRLLALEARRKHIYVAVADNKVATPLQCLGKTKTGVADIQTLQSMISKYSVSCLVIGYPFEAEIGLPTVGLQTKRLILDLIKSRKFEDMKYTLWFDSLKSKAIEHTFEPFELWRFPFIGIMDHYAAYETLQGYVDFFNRNQDKTIVVGEQRYADFVNPNQTAIIP